MAKKESSLLQLLLSLTIISAIAGLTLAAVFSKTQEPIEAARIRKKQEAIMKVLPGFDSLNCKFEKISYLQEGDKDSVCLHLAYVEEKLLGAAVETYTNKAFDGTFSIIVGFDSEGAILQTEVLHASETPGLGDKIDKKKSNFALQFIGKSPENFKMEVINNGGDVVAITAATITSRAFCDAIERAYQAYITVKEQKKTGNYEE
jgi:electron transport complex protein RnfG